MIKATRVYFILLLLSVSLRDVSHPLFDSIPTLDWLGLKITTSAQLISMQVLTLISLGWAALRPSSSLSALAACLSFALFTSASYSMVYANGFGYLPHSENIHFFLIALVGLRNLDNENSRLVSKAMIFVIGWAYLAAFLTKMRNVGPGWAWNETLPYYFETFFLLTENQGLKVLASQPGLLKLIGVFTLAFEALALPGLLWRRSRHFTMAIALFFHLAVYLLFDIQFFLSVLTGFVLIWSDDE